MLNPHRIQSSPNIPLSLPETGEPGAAAARRVILSGWLTMGPETAAFENEFAAAVGAPQACAVSSGTTALHLALLAADARDSLPAPDRDAVRSRGDPAARAPTRAAGDRGCGVRGGERDFARRQMAADRTDARGHRVLFLSSEKGADNR